MEKEASIGWLEYPAKVNIVGDGGFAETFAAEDMGYSADMIQIAGIVLTNSRLVSSPGTGVTEETDYTTLRGEDITVKSVDAARHADSIFAQTRFADSERFIVECGEINQIFFPWEDKVRVFDSSAQDRGLFLIESIIYESEDKDLDIKEMRVKVVSEDDDDD